MMTAEEYRAKASEAQERADAVQDPRFKAAFSSHAREWTALALSADIQAQLDLANSPEAD